MGHERYLFESPVHEAGYDSFMTARVLIKIAARLRELRWYRKDLDKEAKDKMRAAKKKKESKFAHPIMYDLLEFDSSGDEKDPKSSTQVSPNTAAPEPAPANFNEPQQPEPAPVAAPHPGDWHWTSYQPPPPPMMPDWADPMWTAYGNKLRVNGTAEGVCHLEGKRAPASTSAPAAAPAAAAPVAKTGFRVPGKPVRKRRRGHGGK